MLPAVSQDMIKFCAPWKVACLRGEEETSFSFFLPFFFHYELGKLDGKFERVQIMKSTWILDCLEFLFRVNIGTRSLTFFNEESERKHVFSFQIEK